ncbi:hypothetical protein QCA50_016089 [Cerrena zonata]|uniref:Integral membrane protein n=1 Tax=Cerrena zonata TaxID=2478898 RepID=A0AAW0FJJ0_9APHY
MSSPNTTTPIPALDPATIAAIEAIFKVEIDYRVNQYAFVWKGKANMGSFIYILVRHGYIIESAASMPYYLWLNPEFEFCKVFFRVDAWVSTVLSFPITCILGMRTYALYDRKPFAKWLLIVLTLAEIITLIVCQTIFSITAKHTAEPLLIPGTTCIYTLYSLSYGLGIAVFAVSAAYDMIIFLMTALRSVRLHRDGRPRLVTIVLRDCFWYFGILFTADFISFILYVVIPEEHAALRNVLVTPSRAIAVIIVSRLLLNLRQMVSTGHMTTETLTVPLSELQWNPNPEIENKEGGDLSRHTSQVRNDHTQVGERSLVFNKTTTTTSEEIEMA